MKYQRNINGKGFDIIMCPLMVDISLKDDNSI